MLTKVLLRNSYTMVANVHTRKMLVINFISRVMKINARLILKLLRANRVVLSKREKRGEKLVWEYIKYMKKRRARVKWSVSGNDTYPRAIFQRRLSA